jgi:hypothetical protein
VPSVLVVPVYVEVPSGFERAIPTLEAHLRKAGYVFSVGDPLTEALDITVGGVGHEHINPHQDKLRTELST